MSGLGALIAPEEDVVLHQVVIRQPPPPDRATTRVVLQVVVDTSPADPWTAAAALPFFDRVIAVVGGHTSAGGNWFATLEPVGDDEATAEEVTARARSAMLRACALLGLGIGELRTTVIDDRSRAELLPPEIAAAVDHWLLPEVMLALVTALPDGDLAEVVEAAEDHAEDAEPDDEDENDLDARATARHLAFNEHLSAVMEAWD